MAGKNAQKPKYLDESHDDFSVSTNAEMAIRKAITTRQSHNLKKKNPDLALIESPKSNFVSNFPFHLCFILTNVIGAIAAFIVAWMLLICYRKASNQAAGLLFVGQPDQRKLFLTLLTTVDVFEGRRIIASASHY